MEHLVKPDLFGKLTWKIHDLKSKLEKSLIWSLFWCNIPSSLILDMEWREFFVWKERKGALMIRMIHINEEGLLFVLKLLVEQRGTPDLFHLKANAFHYIKNTSQRKIKIKIKIKMENMLRLWFHLMIKLRGHSRFQHWLKKMPESILIKLGSRMI